MPVNKPLPVWPRIVCFVRKLAFSRQCNFAEISCDYDHTREAFVIKFHMPRRPVDFSIIVKHIESPQIKSVIFVNDHESVEVECGIEYKTTGETTTMLVTPAKSYHVSEILVVVGTISADCEYWYAASVQKGEYADLKLLETAFAYDSTGRNSLALDTLCEYEELCDSNPHVLNIIARYYTVLDKYSKTLEYAVRAATNGSLLEGIDVYRNMRMRSTHDTPIKRIRKIQETASKWDIPSHFGVLALQREQVYTLGLNGFHLKQTRDLMLVKREVAARMLRQVSFEFSTRSEVLLVSRLRVIHEDDSFDELDLEKLVFSEGDNENIFITVESEKKASWLLPDLKPGDIIERSYDLLSRDRHTDDKSICFIRSDLFENLPTRQSTIQFNYAHDLKFEFLTRNTSSDLKVIENSDNGTMRRKYIDRNHVPKADSGVSAHSLLTEPYIGCATGNHDWPEIAGSILEYAFGTINGDDPLTDPLAHLIDQPGSKEARLEKAYYWVRDKIKYGAFDSSLRHIGKLGRAEQILSSGMGDCKDKSYLLGVVCQKLGMAFQYVMISTKYGGTIKELPSDQFDHVFLRVKVNEKWLYIDATDSRAPFGTAPYWCQGLDVLVLGDKGEIATVPIDPPGQNLLVMREVIDRIEDGWLISDFFIRAKGHPARSFEEYWKSRSLSYNDRLSAAQDTLNFFLPSIVISSFEALSSTSDSNSFSIAGQCRRCPVTTLGNYEVAQMQWNIPILPLYAWRMFSFEKLFEFSYPMQVEIETSIVGSAASRLRERSTIVALDSKSIRVSERDEKRPDGLSIQRTICVNQKVIEGEDLRQLSSGLESVETAMTLSLAFKQDD